MKIAARFVHRIFSNPDTATGDTRKGFAFLLAYLLCIAVCLLLFAQFLPRQWFWYGWGVSSCMAALAVRRWFEKKEGSGASTWVAIDAVKLRKFFTGFAIGGLILLVINALLVYLLGLHLAPAGGSHIWMVLGWNGALLFGAFHEELGFRSYALRKLQASKGIWKSQAIIALVFAGYHILGGQDIINSLFSTSLWSVVFGLAAVRSGGVAMPTGIHAASTIGQALFGMKLQEGFPALYVLQPPAVLPANIPGMVMITQTLVLLAVITVLAVVVQRKRINDTNAFNHYSAL